MIWGQSKSSHGYQWGLYPLQVPTKPIANSFSFLIGGLCAVLPFGRLYGIYDTKILYCISLILFFAGSALCGGAPNMTAIIIGRVIAGIGGNGMYVGVVTLLSVNTTDVERPMYLGLV
jgi:MFS family permease